MKDNIIGYNCDFVLSKRLAIISKRKSRLCFAAIAWAAALLILASLSLPLAVYFAALFVLYLLFLIVYVPYWIPPRCSQCGKRTKKYYNYLSGGYSRVLFICRHCKLFADSNMQVGG